MAATVDETSPWVLQEPRAKRCVTSPQTRQRELARVYTSSNESSRNHHGNHAGKQRPRTANNGSKHVCPASPRLCMSACDLLKDTISKNSKQALAGYSHPVTWSSAANNVRNNKQHATNHITDYKRSLSESDKRQCSSTNHNTDNKERLLSTNHTTDNKERLLSANHTTDNKKHLLSTNHRTDNKERLLSTNHMAESKERLLSTNHTIDNKERLFPTYHNTDNKANQSSHHTRDNNLCPHEITLNIPHHSPVQNRSPCSIGLPPSPLTPSLSPPPLIPSLSPPPLTPPPPHRHIPPTDSPHDGSTAWPTAQIPLGHVDFWPACKKRALLACDANFETFDVLVKRANRWLRQFQSYDIVSCETVDKKVIYVKDVYNASMFFTDEEGPTLATHIKGLRLWYRHSLLPSPTSAHNELGFLDVTPRYLNPGEKHPMFETLSQTLDKINARLEQKPLPGTILSVETVCLKISRDDWSDNICIDPCQCQWYDEYNTHQLCFVRLFYLANDTRHSRQSIGIQDFTPDDEGGLFHSSKNACFSIIFLQASAWLLKNPKFRVTNFQSLDTKHRKKSENHGHRFNTEKMFEYRIEERFRVVFLRVGYVVHPDSEDTADVSPGLGIQPSSLVPDLACRMYLPYKTTDGYENMSELLQRVEDVIQSTGAMVYHVETVAIPEWLTKVIEQGDIGRTFFDGEWYFVADQDGAEKGPYRYTLIYAIRVYYEGLPANYGLLANAATKKSCCAIL